MRIYLAAPWADREDMSAIAARFEAAGHTITHKWWLEETGEDRSVETLREQAFKDWNGVKTAQAVVLFNTKKSEGKAVEQGIALEAKIPIIAVGNMGEHSQNVFHFLPFYTWVNDIDEALAAL